MHRGLIVLKLGGSVLRGPDSLSDAVHEVYRWRREGFGVVVVVSALYGVTDQLLQRGRHLTGHDLAAWLAGGEHESAALVRGALDRHGVPAQVLLPSDLDLRCHGGALCALPTHLDAAPAHAVLEQDAVVVVPGFSGLDAEGRTVTLGRGGSDLTALFLAWKLGARCRLIKDVPGLFDRDPAGPLPARRYRLATFADALATDGSIVQHEAVQFARRHRQPFELAGVNATEATVVGSATTVFAEDRAPRSPLRVALLGCGTVNGGVLQACEGRADVDVRAVVVGRPDAHAELPPRLICAWPEALDRGIDVLVEAVPDAATALPAVRAALERGIPVVTANKALLAAHGAPLRALAVRHGARLLGSAAVGGSLPVLERVADEDVVALRGVLNGTTNHVLGSVGEDLALADAVALACALGLAEGDAHDDLHGLDAARKLVVLAQTLGWTLEVDEVPRHALTADTPVGPLTRQVAVLTPAGGAVRLEDVDEADPLRAVRGAENAVVLTLSDGRQRVLRGTGAGRWPTTAAVLGDVLEVGRTATPADPRPAVRPRYSASSPVSH